MKMYKKSDLTIINGMLVTADGDIVSPDATVVYQANVLETKLQEAEYLAAQPSAAPMPTLDGFVRKSVKDGVGLKFEISTPLLDAKVEEAIDLMDELDDVTTARRANAMLDDFETLMAFAANDYVVDCGAGRMYQFDTPTLGSVLELTPSKIASAVATICGIGAYHDEVSGEE